MPELMSDISQFLIPKGFRFGAVKAGLKASGRTDFALIPGSAASLAAPRSVDRLRAQWAHEASNRVHMLASFVADC